jgi:MerR family transcriptional regulator, light-induced transcriptional regulator
MKNAGSTRYHPVSLNRESLTAKVLERFGEKHAKTWNDFSLAQRGLVRDECMDVVRSLEESLATDNPAFLIDHASRAQSRFASSPFPREFVLSLFKALRAVIPKELPEDYRETAEAFAGEAVSVLKSAPEGNGADPDNGAVLSPKARSFLKFLLAGDQARGREVIDKALAAGTPVREIYTGIFRPVLRETGRLWEHNEATIAQEHYVTAVIHQIMGQIRNRIASAGRKARKEKTVITACVGEELHEVGIRMVADFFEMEGWNVYYTGANTPGKSILSAVKSQKADVIALSITMPSRLPELHYLIRSLRADEDTVRVKIIVGGFPFGIVPDLWKQVGADAVAADADDAVAAATRLTGSIRATA